MSVQITEGQIGITVNFVHLWHGSVWQLKAGSGIQAIWYFYVKVLHGIGFYLKYISIGLVGTSGIGVSLVRNIFVTGFMETDPNRTLEVTR